VIFTKKKQKFPKSLL